VVDLFAGCGGLSLGLEQAGFTPIMVNELSPQAMDTYLFNRRDKYPILEEKYKYYDVKDLLKNRAKVLSSTVRQIKKDYKLDAAKGEIDLVVGGPPCQGFSGIGHRRSYAVDKKRLPSNHLFQDMIDVIRIIQPKIFLFENVKGLLSARWTCKPNSPRIWNQIRREFAAIDGYDTSSVIIRSADYGVPQNRPRVFIVGIKSTIGARQQQFDFGQGKHIEDAIESGLFPEGQPGSAPNLEDLLSDLIDPEYMNGALVTARYPNRAETMIQRNLRFDPETRKVRGKRRKLSQHKYSKHSDHVKAKFQALIDNNGVVPKKYETRKFAQRLLPRKWEDQGPSITVTSLPDDYVHFEQPRILTVREWARLQTFPDWYDFKGNRTTGGIRRAGNPREGIHDREVPRYTQIGNAVPVALAEQIGIHFRTLLGK
jgi:DNA (cytosine-5)-methyltransferase 1